MYPFKFNFTITTPGSNWSLTPWSKNFIECHQEIRNKHEMTPNNCLPNHLHFSPKSLNLQIDAWNTHDQLCHVFFWVAIYFKYPKMGKKIPKSSIHFMLASNALSIASTSWALLMPDNWEFRDGFRFPPPRWRPRRLARLAFLYIFCCFLMSWDVLYEIKVSDFSWGKWGKQYWQIAW